MAEILVVAVVALAALVLAGWLYQLWGTASDRRRFPPPGRLIEIGRGRLHLVDSGEGTPAVILEAGIAASCLNWTSLRAQLARFTRVCTYDRASLGWSEAAVSARTISEVVRDLHALLAAARIPMPIVMAGHSFGGLVVRYYAVEHPGQVAGLVLVDPLAANEWRHPSEAQRKTLHRGARLSRRGALLARFGVVRFALNLLTAGARRIPQLVARMASSGTGESAISRLVGEVRKMPPETWPMVRAHWCQPKCFLGLAHYLESLTASSEEAVAMGELPGSIPVTILSAANATPQQLAERDTIARHSHSGKHVIAAESGHWVHLDAPDLVVQAICEMVEQVRAGGSAVHSK
jgi:pimeloyl-ACP methyl ester carboxylesterase